MNSAWVFFAAIVASAASSATVSPATRGGNYASPGVSSDYSPARSPSSNSNYYPSNYSPARNNYPSNYSPARSNYPSNYSPARNNYPSYYSPAPAVSNYPSRPSQANYRNVPATAKNTRVRKGKYMLPPPGTKVYYAHLNSPRLFADVESAVAGLPDGEYKLFYTPPPQ